MKKLILIIFSLVLCFSAVACTAEDDTSSAASTEIKDESAVNSLDDELSNESSDNGESSGVSVDNDDLSNESLDDSSNVSDDSSDGETIIPEFDINKVIYNPDENHYDVTDIGTTWFREVTHEGLNNYVSSNEIASDSWFCMGFRTFIKKEDLVSYLEEIGFVKDDALTESFRQNEYDDSVVGYITKEMFEKLSEDNYAIEYTWLPKACVDAGGCHKVIE